MSGFVYIWFDKKHRRYYIGSHWGSPDDGYICSSSWMKQAYQRRPYDFKRRVLKRISGQRIDLYKEEERWLKMIKPEEMRTRYYNLSRLSFSWLHNEKTWNKISQVNKGRVVWSSGQKFTEEHKEKLRRAKLGTKQTEETKRKRSLALKRNTHGFKKGNEPWNKNKEYEYSMETREKMSRSAKEKFANGYSVWNKGKTGYTCKKRPPMPVDVRMKISESVKKYFNERKAN